MNKRRETEPPFTLEEVKCIYVNWSVKASSTKTKRVGGGQLKANETLEKSDA